MNERRKKIIINFLLKNIAIVYLLSACAVTIAHAVIDFINQDPMIDNIILNINTFVLGIISVDKKFMFVKVESIGFFAVHLIIFFSLFFYYLCMEKNNEKAIVVCTIFGILSTIISPLRFPLCINIAMICTGFVYLLLKVFDKMFSSLSDKHVNTIIIITRILLILYSIFATVFPFIEFDF